MCRPAVVHGIGICIFSLHIIPRSGINIIEIVITHLSVWTDYTLEKASDPPIYDIQYIIAVWIIWLDRVVYGCILLILKLDMAVIRGINPDYMVAYSELCEIAA
mgnify:CR=1 FL=1